MFYILSIELNDIFEVWKTHLWNNRSSAIEPTSCIEYGSYPYRYNSEYINVRADYFGIFFDGKLAGVNSGHVTSNSYRSRGLFVFPEYRRMGAGTLLLEYAVSMSNLNGCDFCWSMPRKEALGAYESAGFRKTSDFFETETNSLNCFAINDGKYATH